MAFILSIDQSTAGTKALLVDERGEIVRRSSLAHAQYHPAPGYVEHDAAEIWRNVARLLDEMWTDGVCAIALANQRETTVLWDRATGEPVHSAIVWQDVRAEPLCHQMARHRELVQRKTGLMLSPYYPAAKIMAALAARPDLHARAEAGELCAGTVDSYLVYRMTGGELFATDVSNASRTQLMNLKTLAWDSELLRLFRIPRFMMAQQILPSDGQFGTYRGVPIAAVLGDSHAALFGHGCRAPGQVKASYGTGSSIMLNVGTKPVASANGLSASVGYGFSGEVCYVLEGNVTCSADTLMWLRDDLRLIDDLRHVETLAGSVESTQGAYLVPAFSGLGAPYFHSDARAILCGMSRGTTKAHVVRAALESIAHQNADVLDAMARDMGASINLLSVDGGGSVNGLLMQMQADFIDAHVHVSSEKDLTALGAAHMAGLSVGLHEGFMPLRIAATYAPKMGEVQRRQHRSAWADAVHRAR